MALNSVKIRLTVAVVLVLVLATSVLVPATSDAAQEAVADPGPARAAFAPGTDPAYVQDVLSELLGPPLSGPEAARFGTHWNAALTAMNNGGSSQGDALELTWSIIPDGTAMPSQASYDTTCNSNLIATFDGVYGAGNWQDELQAVWDSWTENTGNIYTPAVTPNASGTPVDDGATWPTTPGAAGVRGDIRIGGCVIDGPNNVLAYNFYPNTGDMKIDATDIWYPNNPLSPNLHNLLSHEHGHGVGLNHVCPVDGTKLMEPIIATGFLGLQHDDLRGAQRGYGDRFELINNPNDNQAGATVLDSAGTQVETSLSLDSASDTDWFRFEASAGEVIDVILGPEGQTYLEGNDPGQDLCGSASPTPLNSLAIQDLSFELRTSAGVLTSVDAAGIGLGETLSDYVIPATGTYYVRVLGSGTNDTQLYGMALLIAPPVTGTAVVGNRVWEDLNGNGFQNPGEPGVADVFISVYDDGGNEVDSFSTNSNGFWTTTLATNRLWTLEFNAPAGYNFTIQDAGSNEGNDSDVDPNSGFLQIPAGTLSPGTTVKTFDAGIVASQGLPTVIGNRVWEDLNGNGFQNPGEPGVGGVDVQIVNADSGNIVETVTTSGNGFWSATVDSGENWDLVVIPPAGYDFTIQDAGNSAGNDSDVDPATGVIAIPAGTLTPGVANKTFDAGLIPAAGGPTVIGNRVWEDLNGNGFQNPGEPGVANVTIRIIDASGNVVETLTTNSNGFWSTTVDSGALWRVRIIEPPNATVTIQNAGSNDGNDSDANPNNGVIRIPPGTLTPGVANRTFDTGLIFDI